MYTVHIVMPNYCYWLIYNDIYAYSNEQLSDLKHTISDTNLAKTQYGVTTCGKNYVHSHAYRLLHTK